MEFSSSSSSGLSKRAKTGGVVSVSCLVDGCNSDLSQCREYHRRHKVCAVHSKTAKVTIDGREQRFCQQCSRECEKSKYAVVSCEERGEKWTCRPDIRQTLTILHYALVFCRFHSLVEFDEGKRSCRKRLDGHNRRRRKPQSNSISRTSGMFISGQQGTTLLSFSNPQVHPSAVVREAAWAGAAKPQDESALLNSHRAINYTDKHNIFPELSAHSYKGVNQLQFLQSTDRINLPEVSSRILSRAGNSDHALSLLSVPTQTRDMASSQMVSTQSLIHNLQFSGLGQFPYTQETESKGLSDSNANHSNTTLQFQGMFHDVTDGSSVGGTHQTLSFRWE